MDVTGGPLIGKAVSGLATNSISAMVILVLLAVAAIVHLLIFVNTCQYLLVFVNICYSIFCKYIKFRLNY